MWSAFFCATDITGDIENFVQISILLNKIKIVEIGTKFFISPVMLRAQKRQTTIWKYQGYGYLATINSRTLLLKFGLRINDEKLF